MGSRRRSGWVARSVVPALAAALSIAGLAACGGTPSSPPATDGPSASAPSGGDLAPLGGATHGALLFHDEFDGGALDESKWTPLRGHGSSTHGGPFNPDHEQAAFDAKQVSVGDGQLRLAGERRTVTVDGVDYPYASGVVTTEGKFTVSQGFVETRMWVPEDTGYWPAAWLVSSSHPQNEIDYAEFTSTPDGSYQPHLNLHWGPDWSSAQQLGWKALGEAGRGYGGTWHTYGVRWSGRTLETYVDGKRGPTFSGVAVPADAMYLVLDLAVHKDRNPPAAVMLVDYVRVWA